MAQVITTIDLIRRAMYLINALPAGEIPDEGDLNDALLTLNELIDSWDLQPMATYSSPVENWVVTPGKSVYDWGVSASPPNFTSERPIFLNNVTCTRNGFTTAVQIVSQDEYDSISLKSTSQPLVERVLYINSFPLGQITLFPVPSEAVTLTFNVNRQLAGPINLQSSIVLPPGYLRALRYNLAVELWPEYTNASTDINSIKNIAKEAFGRVKAANTDVNPSTFENIPNVDAGRSWDWRGG